MTRITCEARVDGLDRWTVLRLPADASRRLPSRGQVAVSGTLNGRPFQTVLEPDGAGGHWMKLEDPLRRAASVSPGDTAGIDMAIADSWPEPTVPPDLAKALARAPKPVKDLWRAITPMARWEWVRWVNATANAATRERRVEVTVSKMSNGKRRPCCFDLSSCTDPELSRNGRLRVPSTP